MARMAALITVRTIRSCEERLEPMENAIASPDAKNT